MSNSRLLEGKVCLITGTSRGIGRSIAEQFAKEGAIVYANARGNGSIDEWAKENSERYHTVVVPLYFDITDTAASKEAVMKIKQEQGHIDVLVNNAAVEIGELIGMISHESMMKMFEVNVYALINLLQFVARIMSNQTGGSIINISSVVGLRGNRGQLVYSATKGAVIALTKSAAKELAPKNIRVNSVAPGLTDTDMVREFDREHLKERISNIGMGRLAKPEDIAGACVFLASDLSEYISGQILGVDGCSIL
ncbi:MAG: 3-oxoacyl-ACP reductase [Firmicutes bacterium HGW-Firmicutes-1]|jgi:3-oxoacyl-[acyl-carrier protein] reductase|nr:MAG: 3-oxoacyl-ACP reductase [Firmicutes bacterium HGW-Firmicutes-1]